MEGKKNQFFVDGKQLSEAALNRKHELESDPSSRTDCMKFMPGMDQIDPTIRNTVINEMNNYDYNKYTDMDVRRALHKRVIDVEDFKALLSPAAFPHLNEMAERAHYETGKHFGNTDRKSVV